MDQANAIQLLKNADTAPSDDVLSDVMGKKLLAVYRNVQQLFDEMNLTEEWKFYKDGNAWLCKVQHKKKTVVWLSVWEKLIKLGFYFTSKTGAGIQNLRVNDEIKTGFDKAAPIGKLMPLTMDISDKEQLTDLREVLQYKISQL
ncbi:DUF3788 family protein [Niabella aquatica]